MTTENITIRPLKRKDSSDAALLLRKILPELNSIYSKKSISNDLASYTSKGISRYLKHRYTMFVGAWAGKRLVGLVMGWGSRGGLGYIDWIAVEPDYRRKRVADRLVKHLERVARNMGMHRMWWDGAIKNKKVNAFSREMGYKKVATLRNWEYRKDWYLWSKRLS